GSLGHLFPLFFFWRRRWQRYPVWCDNLYLSIFWLDMAGNALNLYDRYTHFYLIPHFHRPGALSAVGLGAVHWCAPPALGVANILHVLLEAQEYGTDVFCGTRNVRGAWDSIGDVASGLLGTLVYVGTAVGGATVGKALASLLPKRAS